TSPGIRRRTRCWSAWRETAELPNAVMATTPDEAGLLTMLARLVGAPRALEVGTCTGYGAISIACALAAGGRLTCLELHEEYAAIAPNGPPAPASSFCEAVSLARPMRRVCAARWF